MVESVIFHSVILECFYSILYPSLGEGKFLAFLYNDEVHSYDEVIHTLTHNVKLQHSDAVALATFVDRKVLSFISFSSLSLSLSLPLLLSLSFNFFIIVQGRAVTKVGSEDECLRCNELVNVSFSAQYFQHCRSFAHYYIDWSEYSLERPRLPYCSGGPPAQCYLLHQPAEGASREVTSILPADFSSTPRGQSAEGQPLLCAG